MTSCRLSFRSVSSSSISAQRSSLCSYISMRLVVGTGTSTADTLSANRKLVSHEDLALATDLVFGKRGNMPLMIGSILFDNHKDSTWKALHTSHTSRKYQHGIDIWCVRWYYNNIILWLEPKRDQNILPKWIKKANIVIRWKLNLMCLQQVISIQKLLLVPITYRNKLDWLF